MQREKTGSVVYFRLLFCSMINGKIEEIGLHDYVYTVGHNAEEINNYALI